MIRKRYWKEPIGWERARQIARRLECLQHQIQYLDLADIPKWIERAAQARQRNLRCIAKSVRHTAAWQPQTRMTGDMPLKLHDTVNSVGGQATRAEWDEHCLKLEIARYVNCKRACEVWKQPGWVLK